MKDFIEEFGKFLLAIGALIVVFAIPIIGFYVIYTIADFFFHFSSSPY